MDDKQFGDFLNSLNGLGTQNTDTSNIKRGAFGLPLSKQPAKQIEQPKLTDNAIGKLPVIKQATQLGVGVGTEIGKAGIGLGQTFLKGANVVSNILGNEKNQYNPIIQKMEELKTGVFGDPYKKELSSGFGKAGQLAGDVAVFAEGNSPIAKGQQFLGGATKGLNVANKAVNYGLKKTAQIAPEAIGMGGIQYAVSGGDAKEAGTVGVVSGLLSGLTHVGADVFKTLIPQTVKESVAKIFVPRGKIKLGGTENITDDAVGALQTIKNLAPEIKVVDKDGIEKAFIPEKATLLEMPQVLLQAKDKIYQAYSELATKAGDAGALFGQKDFNSVIADLSKYEGKGYTQAFSNKAKQIQEALNRYGTPNAKDGMFYFKDTPPSEIQTLIEAINKDVNPLSDKAGAEVSLDISRKLREILDDKIATATGGEYQQLRNAYGQLKSIEPTVINEFKKALRGQGIQSDIIDKIATVDTITGILSGNPAGVARGVSWEAVKIAWRKALGKEANLQRAFKIMGKAEKENSALAQRIYTNPSENTPAFKAGEKTVEDIKATPNKEGGFIANPLAETEDVLITEAKKYKSAEEFALSPSHYVDRSGDLINSGDKITVSYMGSEVPATFVKVKSLDGYYDIGSAKGKDFKSYDPEIVVKINGNQTTKGGDVYLKDGQELNMRSLNTNEHKDLYQPIKTKSQLTDIWKKANKVSPESSLLQEAKKYKSAEEFAMDAGSIKDNYDWAYLDEMKTKKKKGYSISQSDFNYLSKIEKDLRGKESKTFYRAGEINKDGDIWLTPQESGAEQYANSGGTKVGEYKVIVNNPLILKDLQDIEKILGRKLDSNSYFANNPDLKDKVIKYAKDNGYDGAMFPDSFPDGGSGMESLVVWDKNQIKTKFQLEEIWNKANKK